MCKTVESFLYIGFPPCKSTAFPVNLVEKPVENVENYWFSTGIFLFIFPRPTVEKSCAGLHKTGYKSVTSILRNRPDGCSSRGKTEKMLMFSEKMLSNPGITPCSPKNLCAKPTKSTDVSSFPLWKYFS